MNWISVEDRLPENEDEVFTYNPNRGTDVDRFHPRGKFGKDITFSTYPEFQVTHWMPLPNCPDAQLVVYYGHPLLLELS